MALYKLTIAAVQQETDEVMCRIAALLPEKYRGVYAGHERVRELLEGSASSSTTG
ncbi:MAG: hypothetical protein IT315_05450 [Anaerolineales bacterium]|nr:hypothetical protein [Anaerolineales bacterium]